MEPSDVIADYLVCAICERYEEYIAGEGTQTFLDWFKHKA